MVGVGVYYFFHFAFTEYSVVSILAPCPFPYIFSVASFACYICMGDCIDYIVIVVVGFGIFEFESWVFHSSSWEMGSIIGGNSSASCFTLSSYLLITFSSVDLSLCTRRCPSLSSIPFVQFIQ